PVFPYTTLFRSERADEVGEHGELRAAQRVADLIREAPDANFPSSSLRGLQGAAHRLSRLARSRLPGGAAQAAAPAWIGRFSHRMGRQLQDLFGCRQTSYTI